ncbi:ATP-binding cassette domain-containing protein [Chryseobacterium balustinum]|uniref:ABC-2 type transport system ATP-binding protein n=1 Tax=Chryseobacterium balustinum TaxID=246 RepID=A0AAX2IQR6_9FLAO|nr:ABC transporter ATP-binding protein [Chryseobacterium balustinum]AZB29488.1 ABC transporter ATP-binding protein [Chryseobacterium balustinum]SKB74418.1 ABC-2 type transport system ATP-binding protein [Chryseobacterium balustinum]SQA92092.1 L-cystine import ATP-binding protein TcyC [Chryseobacterium balustinum]
MTKHQQRVAEVYHFFDNKDTVLGFRKLLDCAIDTQDMSIYKEAIDLTDWKETHNHAIDELIEKSKNLLAKIEKVQVKEHISEQSVLKAKDIVKSYGSNRFSLGPVSVEINKGQVYGLVGENGNGKTTLLRILANEISFNDGSLNYSFNEKSKNEYDLRTKLVYIPQRTEKWYGSLKDNLKFVLSNHGVSPEENETRTLMMIARLGLWNYKHLKWSELSSGYKMRFELARILLRKPEILLLDEPLANLDVLAQQVILEDLKSIANSVNHPIALILSSQQLYEVEKISDKVIFLKNGKYKDNSEVNDDDENQLIIEIDTNESRDKLLEVFKDFKLEKLNFNGGVYVAYFSTETQFYEVISALGNAKAEIIYIRNISSSTRRFFVN